MAARSVDSCYPVFQTIATLDKRTDINSVQDILSKHIFLGPRGGGGVPSVAALSEIVVTNPVKVIPIDQEQLEGIEVEQLHPGG